MIKQKSTEFSQDFSRRSTRRRMQSSTHMLQWLGQAGYRLCIKGPTRKFIVYIDPYLANPMMPASLRREIDSQVVPTDANLILITHSHYQHLASAIPLVLASEDTDCRIVCVPEIAASLRATNMIDSSKLLVISLGGSADLGYMRITMVHANHRVDNADANRATMMSFSN